MSMQQRIEQKVRAGLPVLQCSVENESGSHSVPRGSETHFRLVLVSTGFAGLSLVKRHQLVYGLLRVELGGGVHALALHTYTPEDWDARGAAPDSPACRGGSKAEQGGRSPAAVGRDSARSRARPIRPTYSCRSCSPRSSRRWPV